MPPDDEQAMTGTEGTINVNEAVEDLAQSLNLAEGGDAGGEGKEPGAGTDTTSQEPTSSSGPASAPAAPQQQPAGAQQPAGEFDRVPDTWRKEAQALWAGVDPIVRQEVLKREADVMKFVSEAQPAFQVAQALARVVEPFGPLLQQYGINPIEHIGALLNAHTTLLFGRPEVKAQMFRNLAQQAGIDLTQLSNPNSLAQANTQQLEYIRALEQRMAQMERATTGVASTLHEARSAELEQGIMAFASDTAAHPWFTELLMSGELKALIDSGAARTLTDAYELAVYRNPITRAKQLERDGAAAREAQARKSAEKAAAARKATGANVRSRGSGKIQAPMEESIDETLANTMADIRSRAN